MLSIHTKFMPATSRNGPRIKAYINFCDWSVIIPTDCGSPESHFEAVKALSAKYNTSWNLENMRWGDSSDAKGYTFSFDKSVFV